MKKLLILHATLLCVVLSAPCLYAANNVDAAFYRNHIQAHQATQATLTGLVSAQPHYEDRLLLYKTFDTNKTQPDRALAYEQAHAKFGVPSKNPMLLLPREEHTQLYTAIEQSRPFGHALPLPQSSLYLFLSDTLSGTTAIQTGDTKTFVLFSRHQLAALAAKQLVRYLHLQALQGQYKERFAGLFRKYKQERSAIAEDRYLFNMLFSWFAGVALFLALIHRSATSARYALAILGLWGLAGVGLFPLLGFWEARQRLKATAQKELAFAEPSATPNKALLKIFEQEEAARRKDRETATRRNHTALKTLLDALPTARKTALEKKLTLIEALLQKLATEKVSLSALQTYQRMQAATIEPVLNGDA